MTAVLQNTNILNLSIKYLINYYFLFFFNLNKIIKHK